MATKEEALFSLSGLDGPATEVLRISSDRKTVMVFPCTLSSAQVYGICKSLTDFFEKEGRAFDHSEREVIIMQPITRSL